MASIPDKIKLNIEKAKNKLIKKPESEQYYQSKTTEKQKGDIVEVTQIQHQEQVERKPTVQQQPLQQQQYQPTLKTTTVQSGVEQHQIGQQLPQQYQETRGISGEEQPKQGALDKIKELGAQTYQKVKESLHHEKPPSEQYPSQTVQQYQGIQQEAPKEGTFNKLKRYGEEALSKIKKDEQPNQSQVQVEPNIRQTQNIQIQDQLQQKPGAFDKLKDLGREAVLYINEKTQGSGTSVQSQVGSMDQPKNLGQQSGFNVLEKNQQLFQQREAEQIQARPAGMMSGYEFLNQNQNIQNPPIIQQQYAQPIRIQSEPITIVQEQQPIIVQEGQQQMHGRETYMGATTTPINYNQPLTQPRTQTTNIPQYQLNSSYQSNIRSVQPNYYSSLPSSSIYQQQGQYTTNQMLSDQYQQTIPMQVVMKAPPELSESESSSYSSYSEGEAQSLLLPSQMALGQPTMQHMVMQTQQINQPTMTQPMTQPITQPLIQPVTQPITQPMTQPMTQPVTQLFNEPVTQTMTEPLTTFETTKVETTTTNMPQTTITEQIPEQVYVERIPDQVYVEPTLPLPVTQQQPLQQTTIEKKEVFIEPGARFMQQNINVEDYETKFNDHATINHLLGAKEYQYHIIQGSGLYDRNKAKFT